MTIINQQSSFTALADQDFIAQFEAKTLAPEYFNHLGHIKIAWLYVQQYSLPTAIDKTCVGIKAYAESLGAKDKFHLTITDALVRIIYARVGALPSSNWADFIASNQDLVSDALSVLKLFYTDERLFSERAKSERIPPDLMAIE